MILTDSTDSDISQVHNCSPFGTDEAEHAHSAEEVPSKCAAMVRDCSGVGWAVTVLNIGRNIDVAVDIAFWNTQHSDISNFIAFRVLREITAQYQLGPNIAATISNAK